MKILLINPPIREWAKPNCFPSGLGYIATYLLNGGHEVEVLDINAYRYSKEELEKIIKEAEFDIVGIGGIVTVYKKIKGIISLIKKYHPYKKIIVGGSVATSIPHIILEKTEADIACIGEGEITVLEILNSLEESKDLKEVKGIWYKEGEEIIKNPFREYIKDLDSIPFPTWDIFPMDIYLKNPIGAPNVNKWNDGASLDDNGIKTINLIPTRGCAYKCIYCYHDFMGARYRYRSPQNILDEIIYLYEKYQVRYFHFTDDCFVTNVKKVMEFCNLLIKKGINIQWGCAGRVNLMSEDLIILMKKAGCILIGYGIESGSQKMLDVMKKKVTVEQAKRAIQLTQKHLGWADCSFMIGTPGENRETIQETIDFCKELNLTPEVIFFVTPYPGTELYQMAREMDKIKDEEEYILRLGEQGENLLVNFSELKDEELIYYKEKMVEELNAWNKYKHNID